MTGKYKIKEGSQLVANAPKIYDAIVYQDATRTYAVDKNGNILSSGLISAATDNVQIQAALSSLPITGGVVIISPGIYSIATSLTIPNTYDSVVIRGFGTKSWDFSTNSGITILIQAADVDILQLNGTAGSTMHGIVIEDITFKNTGGFAYTGKGIDVVHNVNVIINRCSFLGLKGNAINFHTTYVAQVMDCSFQQCGVTATTTPVISVNGSGTDNCTHIEFQHCVFEEPRYKAIDCTACKPLMVHNCYFEGIGAEPSAGHIVLATNNYVNGGMISENEMYDCGNTGDFITCGYWTKVTDNNISGTTGRYGVYVHGFGSVVSGNTIQGNTSAGIYSDAADCTISNNNIYNCGTSVAPRAGIAIVTNGSRNSITGNNCWSNGLYGIYISSVTGTSVIGNNCSYATFGGTQNYGVYETGGWGGSIVLGNLFQANTVSPVSADATSVYSMNKGYVDVTGRRNITSSLLDVLGSPKLLCACPEITGTSISDYTRNANTLTASASVATWYGFAGGGIQIGYYNFNGTSHYLYKGDDTDFTFGNGITDSAFSVVALVMVDGVTSRTIMGKWDETTGAEKREWRLFFDASGYLTFQLYDESANTYIGRQYQTVYPSADGVWRVIEATYDGSGVASGCKLYSNGLQVDDADFTSGVYAGMEDTASQLYVGCKFGAAAVDEFYDGKMTWMCITTKELSADEVWGLYIKLRASAGV